MMRHLLIIAALAALLPWSAGAQVDKRVEVTKAYVPSVESASKLSIRPDMTDTTKIRPEIDYSVTPLSLKTALTTRPIRPATVTYWEFNRPLPFYLKLGAGYPLNSVLDFYASSQNPGTGYVVGYINHEGSYDKIKNNFDQKNKATQMLNRIGAAAGKYFGNHVLEGDVSYENRLYNRYGMYLSPDFMPDLAPGSKVNFGDANAAFRFGDDFQNLERTNFELAIRGGMFFDHSSWPDYGNKARQTTLEAHGKIARGFGRHRLSAELGYERLAGDKALDDYKQNQIHAALRYGINGGVVRLEAGADYYHDKVHSAKAENYLVPFAHLNLNLGTEGLCPFLEVDGSVNDNSYQSLTQQNPYLQPAIFGLKSSVDYNGRFGVSGSLWRGKFAYRAYVAFSILDHHVYWYGNETYTPEGEISSAFMSMNFVQARQTISSINGEITWRPVSALRADLEVHGYTYNDKDTNLHHGAPKFEGKLALNYDGRKISFGAGIYLESERKWSVVNMDDPTLIEYFNTFKAPFSADLRANFGWKISGGVSLFAEGRNLLNRRLYLFPGYRGYGANFTAGVKLNF